MKSCIIMSDNWYVLSFHGSCLNSNLYILTSYAKKNIWKYKNRIVFDLFKYFVVEEKEKKLLVHIYLAGVNI